MVWMVSTSIKTEFASIQQPPVWIPAEPTFEQYTQAALASGPDRAAVPRAICATASGSPPARRCSGCWWRSRPPTPSPASAFPGREPLFFSVLVRNMFPVVVFLIPLFILMKFFGLIDTHFSLILTYLTFGLPLSIWLLKGFYDNIPPELERAARIDGATRFQAFWKIILPLSTPGWWRPRSTPSSRAGTSTSTPAPSSTRRI